jgi:hypothetical protein
MIRILARNLLTTCCISAWFFVCLTLLGPLGYLPAIGLTALYFTWKDDRRPR